MIFDKMKTLQFLLVTTISLLIFSCGNETKESKAGSVSRLSKDDEKEILEVINKQSEDWNKGDLEKFMEGYWKSDSLQFISRKRLTKGWKRTLENYKKTYADSTKRGQLQFAVINFDAVSDDAVIVTGRFLLTKGKRNDSGISTLVFKKIDGRWVIVHDHTN
jgi:uncharacterized protein (TIGR02246 family)